MKTLAAENNYKYIRDINNFYGESNGYFFYGEPTQYVSLFRVIFTVENTDNDQLKVNLDRICGSYRAISHEGVRFESNKAILELRPQGLSEGRELKTIIDAITLEMSRMSVKQSDDGIYTNLGLYRIGTHLAVKSSDSVELVEKQLKPVFKKQSPTPAMAYLMALVYMVPAIALYAVVNTFGWISSFLSFFIVTQALKGFTKNGGEPTKKSLSLLIVLSLLGVIAGSYLSIFAVIITEVGYFDLSFFALIPLNLVIENAVPAIIIGLAFNWRRIRYMFTQVDDHANQPVTRTIRKLL